MTTTVTLDKAGRVLIPKVLRDELHLEPGDELELKSENERVTLTLVSATAPLSKVRGVWVFRSGKKLSASETDQALKDVRNRRDHDNIGSDQ